MSQNEIITTVSELQELRRLQEELNAEIEALQDRIKAHMTEQGAERIVAGAHKVSWIAVTAERIDTTAFKKALPEVAERFTKTTITRRFSVA